MHVIEGIVDVVLFDDTGHIAEIINMGDYSSGRKFYYRISDPIYHTLLIHSDFLVFHETTNGPFSSNSLMLAPWSPNEKENPTAAVEYSETLMQQVLQSTQMK